MTKTLITPSGKRNVWVLAPVLGIMLFIVFYIVATLFYPGGSQVDRNSIGFSWAHNYWCNLLNENAIDGSHNPAKPIAMTWMFVLCVSLISFWFLFTRYTKIGKIINLVIQFSGTLAMMIAFFLFTSLDHDLVTNLASLFGLIAMAGTFIGLYRAKCYLLFMFGLFNLLLVGMNNYFYYSKELIMYLPIIQKISFTSFLTWICSIDIHLYRNLPVSGPEFRRFTVGDNH